MSNLIPDDEIVEIVRAVVESGRALNKKGELDFALLEVECEIEAQELGYPWDVARRISEVAREYVQDNSRAKDELRSRIVWRSASGQIIAIRDGSPQHIRAAFANGIQVVVFQNGQAEIGVQRAPDCAWLHIGQAIDSIERSAAAYGETDLADELKMWNRHVSGRFAGRTGATSIPDGVLPKAAAWITEYYHNLAESLL